MPTSLAVSSDATTRRSLIVKSSMSRRLTWMSPRDDDPFVQHPLQNVSEVGRLRIRDRATIAARGTRLSSPTVTSPHPHFSSGPGDIGEFCGTPTVLRRNPLRPRTAPEHPTDDGILRSSTTSNSTTQPSWSVSSTDVIATGSWPFSSVMYSLATSAASLAFSGACSVWPSSRECVRVRAIVLTHPHAVCCGLHPVTSWLSGSVPAPGAPARGLSRHACERLRGPRAVAGFVPDCGLLR